VSHLHALQLLEKKKQRDNYCKKKRVSLCLFPYRKIVELEEELRVVGNNLKSLEVSEEKASIMEESYTTQMRSISDSFKEAEARAEFAERSVQKLQKEVDRLEDSLLNEKAKFKSMANEMDQTFAELAGY